MTIAALRNPIQHYDWGSHTDIASLLGLPPAAEPEAEMWMGAYPGASSEVLIDGSWLPLTDCLDRFVSQETQERFGRRLPFLMKYLAIARPLSIQVHPADDVAAKGYADGIFKDPYGKPELIHALTPVEMLVGFRPKADVASDLEHLGRQDLVALLEELSPGELFVSLLSDDEFLHEVKNAPHLARELSWLPELLLKHPNDPAATAPLFMNHIHLLPGEAIYVPTGIVHCYLSGFAVEVMATSDNVIRAGMTSKPVDIPHFAENAFLNAQTPQYVLPEADQGWERFPTSSREFELSRATLTTPLTSEGLALISCAQGRIVLASSDEEIEVVQGQSVIIDSKTSVTISGSGVIYRCALPTA